MKANLVALTVIGLASALFAQAPTILPPSATPVPPTPPPAVTNGSGDMIQIVKALGPLADNLTIAFSMDRSLKGSVAFSQPGLMGFAHFFGPVNWVNDAGHQCVSFAKYGSKLSCGMISLHENYTLSTWMKFPVPSGNAIVWDTFRGPMLAVNGGKFNCGKGTGLQTFCDVGAAPAGWHRVVVTSDGKGMYFYLDSTQKGTAKPMDCTIINIGGAIFPTDGEAQCDCLDDMLLFDRALTPQEVVALGSVRLPIHLPSDDDLEAAAKATPMPVNPPVVVAPPQTAPVGPEAPVPLTRFPGAPPGFNPFTRSQGGRSDILSPPNPEYTQIVKGLGALSDDLIFGLSMDNPTTASIVRLRPESVVTPVFAPSIQWINDEGRQCASFAKPGSVITSDVAMMEKYSGLTMAVWIKLPTPTGYAVIADGRDGPVLGVKSGAFFTGKGAKAQTFCTIDPLPDGWHHVAVSFDRSQLSFFFDGVLKGSVPKRMGGFTISAIGNSMNAGEPANCGCLDDALFFKRALTAQEIATVSALRLPIHPPTEIAGVQPQPTTPPVTTIPAAVANAASDLVKDYDKSLVLVTSENGPAAGSGFIASYGTGAFLFTNAHVAAGVRNPVFRTLDGMKLQVGAAAVAVGHDIVLMQTTSSGKPLEITKGADKDAAIGDDVVVLGNAEGAGVVKTILGKIVGLGPNLVEIDAPFVPGNSGSPIVHLKSGKVIGIATYHSVRSLDPATKQPLAVPEVRRFGYRLDSVKSWQTVNWTAFAAQADELQRIDKFTADLRKFLIDVADNHRIVPEDVTNPILTTRVQAYLAEIHGHVSDQDVASATGNFVATFKSICRSDTQSAQARLTYDYFQRKLVDIQREREALTSAIDADVPDIRNSGSDPTRRIRH